MTQTQTRPRKGSEFAGLSVALVTPFRDGDVDYAALREQVEFQIAAGTDCLCPVGTTGESPTLSHEEHERVISEVIQAGAGRIKVMPGTGSNSTREALRLTAWAAKEGANAALMVAPYYNKPTQQGFYEHYKAVAEQVELPICVYNIPGRTGKNIEPETIARLAELDRIVMVKEATGSLDQASSILTTTDLTILSGDDSLTPAVDVGGWRRRDFGRRQYRAARHARHGAGVPRRRCSRRDGTTPSPVPAVSRHVVAGVQPDSAESRHANAGARHRRAAFAHGAVGRRSRGPLAANSGSLRPESGNVNWGRPSRGSGPPTAARGFGHPINGSREACRSPRPFALIAFAGFGATLAAFDKLQDWRSALTVGLATVVALLSLAGVRRLLRGARSAKQS